MARTSILAFNEAVQTKDFTAFHGQISKLWQDQITPAKLKAVFQSFIEKGIDVSKISDVDPVFSEPAKIDGDGVLILQGHYPTAPSEVQFRLKYVSEKGDWKLVGIKLDVAPAGAGKLPSEKEARALALDSLLALNEAVKTNDFAEFHGKIAAAWQAETTAEKLQENFQSLIEKETDFGLIANVTPTFSSPPAINSDGILEMEGLYPTRPHQLHFRLGYLFEEPNWRLVRIKVNIDSAEDDKEEDGSSD